MEPVLLLVLEVTRPPREVLQTAEIEKTAIRKETRGIGLLINGRTAHLMQTESRKHVRFRKNFAGVFVRDGQDNRIRDVQTRVFGVGQACGPDRHIHQYAVRIRWIVPQEKLVRL